MCTCVCRFCHGDRDIWHVETVHQPSQRYAALPHIAIDKSYSTNNWCEYYIVDRYQVEGD